MAARFAWSGLQLNTAPGKPLSLGKIIFKATGTENDQDTFTAVGLGVANANPLILDANGRVPEAWSAETTVYRIRVTDADDNIIIPSIDDYSFLAPVSVTAAQVVTALAANAASLVLNGADLDGTAFADFIGALTLGAAGSIDASAGTITLGSVTGATTFAALVTLGAGLVSDTDSTDDLGTTGVRFLNLFVDKITLTGGDASLTVDNTENTGIPDAYGLITAGTTVIGQGIASVSTSGTGVFTVVFDNAADSIDEQLVQVTGDGTSAVSITATHDDTTNVTIRVWLSADATTALNQFPIAITRWLFT